MYNIWTISSETFKLNERSKTIEKDIILSRVHSSEWKQEASYSNRNEDIVSSTRIYKGVAVHKRTHIN